MKISKVVFGAVLALSAVSSSAFSFEKAKRSERTLLCTAIDQLMEEQSVDAAIDLRACLTNTNITSKLVTEGIRLVSGKLKFNSPSRHSYTVECEVAYLGTPTIENIVGGIEAINCK